MLTYDNDGYGFANFDAVLAHEMGHVFGALDEYEPPAPGYPSTGRPDAPATSACATATPVSGRHDRPTVHHARLQRDAEAFAPGSSAASTIGQTGLRDSDADTRPDVVDTRPVFTTGLESTDETDGAVTLRGAVAERPRHRGRISAGVYFRHDLSIKVPHDVQYRVDGGAWQPLTADGRRVRRAVRGLVADHRAALPRATTCSTSRGPPARRPAGPGTSGPAPRRSRWSSRQRRVHEEGADGRGRFHGAALRAQHRHGAPACPCRASRRSARPPRRRQTSWTVLTTGENGVWTGTLKPARTRTYEVRFAGAGQFQGPAASGRVTITVR